jgi:hypothetical protein
MRPNSSDSENGYTLSQACVRDIASAFREDGLIMHSGLHGKKHPKAHKSTPKHIKARQSTSKSTAQYI